MFEGWGRPNNCATFKQHRCEKNTRNMNNVDADHAVVQLRTAGTVFFVWLQDRQHLSLERRIAGISALNRVFTARVSRVTSGALYETCCGASLEAGNNSTRHAWTCTLNWFKVIAFAGAEAELDDRQGVGTRIWHTDPGGCKSIFGCIQNLLPHFPGLPTG